MASEPHRAIQTDTTSPQHDLIVKKDSATSAKQRSISCPASNQPQAIRAQYGHAQYGHHISTLEEAKEYQKSVEVESAVPINAAIHLAIKDFNKKHSTSSRPNSADLVHRDISVEKVAERPVFCNRKDSLENRRNSVFAVDSSDGVLLKKTVEARLQGVQMKDMYMF